MAVPAGTRVEIRYTLLDPAERATGLPDDTAAVPYVVRVRGTLQAPAAIGEQAAVRTSTGRLLHGELTVVEPGDTHTFGRPVPALVETIAAIHALKAELNR